MTFGTFMTIIRSKYNPYLLYFFRSNYFRQQIGVGENTMINQITKYMLDAVRVPLPPLREQKRIVTILDEAFEGIDRAIANTEKNLANARILFENYLWSVFTTKGKGWTEHRLGDIVTFIDYRGKTPPKRDGGIRLITAKNVKMGYIRRTPEEFVEPSAYDAWMTRGFPRKGDVLFTTEAPLGNVAQIDTDEKIIIGQRLITFQPDDRVLDRTLLKFALMSQPVQKQIFMRATGATVLGIKASLLKQVPISFPEALLEQAALAAGIQEFSEACRQLGSIYQEKLRALQDLRQALLHKAFTGELSAGTAETVQEAAQ
jgi:type I restriction enzyme S subunit